MKKVLLVLCMGVAMIGCNKEELVLNEDSTSKCTSLNFKLDCKIFGVWRNASTQVELLSNGDFIETELVGGQLGNVLRSGTWRTNLERTAIYVNNGTTEYYITYHYWLPSDSLFLDSMVYDRF